MPFINDPQGRQEVEKVSRRLKLPVWKSICKGEFRKWWNEWWDKIDTFAETIEAVEIKAGTGLKGGGNLTENRTLSLKEATKTDLGGIIIGENLTYNPVTKAVDGNPTYTHPTTEGNKHIPAGGAAGNIILWGSSGTGTWGKLKYTDIVGTPTSLKNPYSLTLQFNGINQEGYNGEAAKTINITPEGIKAAEKVHKHSKEDITDLSLSKPLTIKFNGTSQGEYTGEVAKEIDITPAQIGAEVAFNKNSAFNKNFGTTANTILDGAKLAETLGIPYGGSLNNTNAKTVGTAYYDSTTKKTYKCTIANSLNYADNNYYEAISNNDLLVKLQNLTNVTYKKIWSGSGKLTETAWDFDFIYASLISGDSSLAAGFFLVEKIKITEKVAFGLGNNAWSVWSFSTDGLVITANSQQNLSLKELYGIKF